MCVCGGGGVEEEVLQRFVAWERYGRMGDQRVCLSAAVGDRLDKEVGLCGV